MSIYQHFRKEEHPFIDQVFSWKETVQRTYQPKLTDFLDPREQQIVQAVIGSEDEEWQLKQYGGGLYTERKRAIIAPFYEQITPETYQLQLLQATYHDKFISLSHRDVMGAFLSLGIKRKKLGDIFVGDGLIQIITAREIAQFVIMNLTTIKHATVKFTAAPLSNIKEIKPNWIETSNIVSSLRLDNVVKEIYNISRKDAVAFIQKQYVKVNYRVVDDAAFPLQQGDVLSLRGKGRSKLVAIHGQTKKQKLRITTALLT